MVDAAGEVVGVIRGAVDGDTGQVVAVPVEAVKGLMRRVSQP